MPNPFEKYLTEEDRLHAAIIQFLELNNILFIHCPSEGRKTPFERYKYTVLGGINKKGFPDIFCPEPRTVEGKFYCGLAIELKVPDKINPVSGKKMKGGKLSPEQEKWIMELSRRGYCACVCFGIDSALQVIRKYFSLK